MHLSVAGAIVALKSVLGVGLKERPAGVEVDIDMELFAALELLNVGSVDANDVSNLSHDWALFEPVCVNYHHGKLL